MLAVGIASLDSQTLAFLVWIEGMTIQSNLSSLQPDSSVPVRLLSLDVFRGVVILAMLIVNNLGDFATTGYFWKHAGFIAKTDGYASVQYGAFAAWWNEVKTAEAPLSVAFTQLPIWKHVTLADYVMPGFMLIIGLAMPYSVAAGTAKQHGALLIWLRVLKRAAVLVLLGWILCYFRDQFAPWWRDATGAVALKVICGMDVLQLLGVAYLVSRVLYALPAKPRLAVAIGLFIWHWAVLRFWPQGDEIARGTFTAKQNAISVIYAQDWWIWRSFNPFPWLSIHWKGLMSVPPAVGMMLLGTLMGDWFRRSDVQAEQRVKKLASAGALCALAGFLWAFDLPFNKDRWTPCYLLWCAGVGAMLIAMIFVIVDIRGVRGWTYPFIVLGSNAIAAYFLSIMAKVLLMNTPQVDESRVVSLALVRYGTLVFVTLTGAWAMWLLVRAAVRHKGPVAHALWTPAAGVIFILWYRLVAGPAVPSTQPSLTNVTNAIGGMLKQSLGAWEGGWVFTIFFVLFWWLVLDAAYRKRIFWKL